MLLPAVPKTQDTGLAYGSHVRVGVACEPLIKIGCYLLCSTESVNVLGGTLFGRIDGFTTTSEIVFDVDTDRILDTAWSLPSTGANREKKEKPNASQEQVASQKIRDWTRKKTLTPLWMETLRISSEHQRPKDFIGTAVISIIRYFVSSWGLKCTTLCISLSWVGASVCNMYSVANMLVIIPSISSASG